jgi:RNA polymerase sigma-54 factor
VERVKEGVDVIAKLDPKPGLPFASGASQYVIPDVVVERNEHDEWIVSVPNGHLPKVQVSESYFDLYEKSADQKEKAYLKEKISGARFIIDAIAQRRRTLLRIVSEIIKHQTAFLEHGVEHLRPLMRQDIADKIGMHVATVSRAVKDKYIQTPGGIMPLSSFFSGGIATQDGSEAESSKSVKLKIQKLIQAEDPRNPLSDQEIADKLAKDGLDISRRTVTKYRIADGVPSTRQRRTF